MTGRNHLIFGVTSGFLLDAALLAKTGNTYGIDVATGIITLSALGSFPKQQQKHSHCRRLRHIPYREDFQEQPSTIL